MDALMGMISRAGGLTKICRVIPEMQVTMILYSMYVKDTPSIPPGRGPSLHFSPAPGISTPRQPCHAPAHLPSRF